MAEPQSGTGMRSTAASGQHAAPRDAGGKMLSDGSPAGCPGLVAGTRVLTGDGIYPVELLGAGDRIITRNTGLVRLAGLVFGQVRGDFVQVAAGALGAARPETDTVLAADQTVLLRGAPAVAICGGPSVMIRAGDLVYLSGCTVLQGVEMTVVRMVFDTPQLVYADGLETLCLPERDSSLAA